MASNLLSIDDIPCRNQTVIVRLDINSALDRDTGELLDDTRIRRSLPVIEELADRSARLVMLAHQGDTEAYASLRSLAPHARRLAELLARPVEFVDDICGPSAQERIASLAPGQLLLVQNVRYLTEEVSSFTHHVKLSPPEMARTRLVQNLAPLASAFVCEAFAAAHRSSPSLIGFTEVLPAAAGPLFLEELEVLTRVRNQPRRPCVYLLGGARISDAFSLMDQVLSQGTADQVLTTGVTGEVMRWAQGHQLGEATEKWIRDRGLESYVAQSKRLLAQFGAKILAPDDFATAAGDVRAELSLDQLPASSLLVDIGARTCARYAQVLARAATVFVNGPAGIFEREASAVGTRALWNAVADSPGYSIVGGGESIAAAHRFGVAERLDYLCTAGGCMVRFLSGQRLPVVDALEQAAARHKSQLR